MILASLTHYFRQNLRKLSQASSLKFFIGLLVCVAFLAVLICNGWIPYTPTAVLMIPSEPPVDQTMRVSG